MDTFYKEIDSLSDIDNFIIENNNNLILLYFGASWCGPCNKLKSKFKDPDEIINISKLKIAYIDIDIESNGEIIKLYNISNIPTLIFVKLVNNDVIVLDKIIGFDWSSIKFKYNKLINI